MNAYRREAVEARRIRRIIGAREVEYRPSTVEYRPSTVEYLRSKIEYLRSKIEYRSA